MKTENEAAYRRGCDQAAAMIEAELKNCLTLADARRFAAELKTVLHKFRGDRKQHPALLDEAVEKVLKQRNPRGIRGIESAADELAARLPRPSRSAIRRQAPTWWKSGSRRALKK